LAVFPSSSLPTSRSSLSSSRLPSLFPSIYALRHRSINLSILVQIKLCLHLFNDRSPSAQPCLRHLLASVPAVNSSSSVSSESCSSLACSSAAASVFGCRISLEIWLKRVAHPSGHNPAPDQLVGPLFSSLRSLVQIPG
jgi:hypothetical protein